MKVILFYMVVCMCTVYAYVFMLVFRQTTSGFNFCANLSPLFLVCICVHLATVNMHYLV